MHKNGNISLLPICHNYDGFIGIEFEFSLIPKDGVRWNYRDIDTHSKLVWKSAPLISKLQFTYLKYKSLNKVLNYIHIHMLIFIFKLSVKQDVFSIFFIYLKKIILLKQSSFELLTFF
jgi:hypothetical protein